VIENQNAGRALLAAVEQFEHVTWIVEEHAIRDSQLAVRLAVADDVLHAVRRRTPDAARVEIVLDRLNKRTRFGRIDKQAVHVGTGAAGVRLRVPVHRDIEYAGASHLRSKPLDGAHARASALVQPGHEISVYFGRGIARAQGTEIDAVTADTVMNVVHVDRDGRLDRRSVDHDTGPSGANAVADRRWPPACQPRGIGVEIERLYAETDAAGRIEIADIVAAYRDIDDVESVYCAPVRACDDQVLHHTTIGEHNCIAVVRSVSGVRNSRLRG